MAAAERVAYHPRRPVDRDMAVAASTFQKANDLVDAQRRRVHGRVGPHALLSPPDRAGARRVPVRYVPHNPQYAHPSTRDSRQRTAGLG